MSTNLVHESRRPHFCIRLMESSPSGLVSPIRTGPRSQVYSAAETTATTGLVSHPFRRDWTSPSTCLRTRAREPFRTQASAWRRSAGGLVSPTDMASCWGGVGRPSRPYGRKLCGGIACCIRKGDWVGRDCDLTPMADQLNMSKAPGDCDLTLMADQLNMSKATG